ncbi:threonine/serine exporter family protein [Novosphingobium album (ex Liu et al. 2023)]|uniref:Threonine/serine exporter family protein n=1 Tax=Novosphingobium album (ex Liu et al. 2023) TaxID=3031130 RepID=A0ABT5WSL8_9SPHN|nr:threonine/serine exporter family protein [Novosphingobium album (ex Liu et al. 2023)]MDE8653034.1 threonine/serine exporter family protein [Novosphingobium album (ex Liu et al. 2023)]
MSGESIRGSEQDDPAGAAGPVAVVTPFPGASEDLYHDLEKITDTAIAFGRVLMESGASVKVIEEGATLVARGLGARPIGLRTGYASLTFTVSGGGHRVTRMRPVGRHVVNHRLDRAVRQLALEVAEQGGDHASVRARLDKLVEQTPRYSPWLVAVGTGAACAAFGQLLGMDWLAIAPVLAGGTIGQYARHQLLHRGINVYVMAAIVAFLSATLGGLGALAVGSSTVTLATVASTLLLVPGVPATNAQTDIMDGFPTVGSARAVGVAMLMVFTACGIWFAETLIRSLS